MKKITGEFRNDLHLRWQSWLKMKSFVLASFSLLIDGPQPQDQNSGGKPKGKGKKTVVQQETGLGG